MSGDSERYVTLGKVSGLYGVRGWIKVYSWTQPRAGILEFHSWRIKRNDLPRVYEVDTGRSHGKGIVAKLRACDDREAARGLIGSLIQVRRTDLPGLESGEFYWADLLGLKVETLLGVELGVVDSLLETGANDVLVVKGDRERLVPFLEGQVVHEVSLDERRIRVDWDPDF